MWDLDLWLRDRATFRTPSLLTAFRFEFRTGSPRAGSSIQALHSMLIDGLLGTVDDAGVLGVRLPSQDRNHILCNARCRHGENNAKIVVVLPSNGSHHKF